MSGYRTFLKNAPVNVKSAMQRTVAISVTEAEANASVSCVQDMLYTKHVLESIGLQVELPMLLEIDNKGAVDLINNWSVGGRTRHMDMRLKFMRELKEEGIIEIKWIPGSENDADLFTKVFCGDDEYYSS